MPSNFLTPFLELDDEFCKSFCSMDLTQDAQNQRVVGFQRRHSLCPVTLPNSKFNSGESGAWPGVTHSKLPASSLQHIPFRVDRSVSMIEGTAPPLAPPPGLGISPRALSTSAPMSTRYKTELCRTYEESGTCKYGAKCQFAHGLEELRGLSRHPKYKTEPCRTFHTIGFCPYGARCHFIHNADELENPQGQRSGRERPQLRQSVSFSGFSSHFHAFSRSSSVSPPPSSSSDLLSPVSFKTPTFYAIQEPGSFSGLQRSSSADSLSDPEDYTSSSSLSGSDSPGVDARRLPIFSRLSVSDD